MISRKSKILAFLVFVFAVFTTWDMYEFVFKCRAFHERAKLELKQLDQNDLTDFVFVVLTGDKNRIPKALELLQVFSHSRLLISGISKKTNLIEIADFSSEKVRSDLQLWKRVDVDSQASSTLENAKETQKYLRQQGKSKIVLITSDYHLTRSLAVFEQQVKGEVVPYAIASDWPGKALLEYWKWVAFRLDII